jgi:hypothetical protein
MAHVREPTHRTIDPASMMNVNAAGCRSTMAMLTAPSATAESASAHGPKARPARVATEPEAPATGARKAHVRPSATARSRAMSVPEDAEHEERAVRRAIARAPGRDDPRSREPSQDAGHRGRAHDEEQAPSREDIRLEPPCCGAHLPHPSAFLAAADMRSGRQGGSHTSSTRASRTPRHRAQPLLRLPRDLVAEGTRRARHGQLRFDEPERRVDGDPHHEPELDDAHPHLRIQYAPEGLEGTRLEVGLSLTHESDLQQQPCHAGVARPPHEWARLGRAPPSFAGDDVRSLRVPPHDLRSSDALAWLTRELAQPRQGPRAPGTR